jgi:hypothetical protein
MMVRIVSSAGTSFASCTRDPSPTFLLAGCQSHRCEPLYYLSRVERNRTPQAVGFGDQPAFPEPTLSCISFKKPRKATWISPGDLWASHCLPPSGVLVRVSPKASPVHLSVPGYPTLRGSQRHNELSRGGSIANALWRRRRWNTCSLRVTIPRGCEPVKRFLQISQKIFVIRRKHQTRRTPTRIGCCPDHSGYPGQLRNFGVLHRSEEPRPE